MNTLTFGGAEGELRWGYHHAASLGTWTLKAGQEGLVLTAKVVSHDTFRTSQPSLTFRVPRPKTAPWVWPVESLRIEGGTLHAVLTPQKD
jgi:hypothetical protein